MLATIALLATTVQSGFDPSRLATIPTRMAEFSKSGKVAGTVVLVARKGRTVLLNADGFANLETRTPMRPDTIFQIMSMTKPLTAILVVRCAEEGRLNLDDRIEKYLPGFQDLKVRMPDGTLAAPRTKPTIRHLLTHTGGFSGNDPAGLDDDQKVLLTLKAYGDLMHKDPILSNPGEQIRYSGPGFATAGRIVEIVSGMSLEAFAKSRMFDPLKMKDTFYFAPTEKYDRIARVYDIDRGRLTPMQSDPYRKGAKFANPAGGVYSTADDMAKLMNCLVANGSMGGYRLLSPAGVEALTTLQTGDLTMDGNDEQGYGLGFTVVRRPSGGSTLKPAGAFGHIGAFGTEFWADRKRGVVAVFLSQGFDSDARKTFNTLVNAAFVGP